ncbi:hypothetical protein LCM20_13445 [Halobacillus litoralis]|uniref:hypothetical protein n=1 Tax=Halobacillus litoralis TaxID=45668 RepID=UPI001CD3764E|nr:hypothetical protein [Halobacillus litoralis]MCA0971606.1 hypothetical protein [Halobacillus litoralis]
MLLLLVIILSIILIVLIGAIPLLVDTNRKVTRIANKMDLFDIEDRKVSNEEIENELEKRLK